MTKKFKVLVHGQNLKIYLDGELVRAGFYVTRVVSAPTPKNAEETALKEVSNLPKLRKHMIENPDDPATFEVEKIEEIQGDHPLELSPSGLAFYKMEVH